jgi:spermidine synthase
MKIMVLAFPILVTSLLSLCSVGYAHAAEGAPSTSVSALPEVGELITETGFYQSIRVVDKTPIFRKQSKFQLIEVLLSPYYGKVLVLDGVVQLAERDADAYNEMMAHMAMFQHREPKRVLVIGGGDGYVLSEVLKHSSVEHVDHVDLDGDVVDTCREHFSWGAAWEDPRVKLHIADGTSFVQNAPDGYYDVIIQDSSDPWTWNDDGEKVTLPSSVLYSPEHFGNLYRVLSTSGILTIQAESLQIPSDIAGTAEWRQCILEVGFRAARYGTLMISSYPTGQIGFLLSEKDPASACSFRDIQERFRRLRGAGKVTTYYHPRLQESSFGLPLWAEEKIYGTDHYNSVCDIEGETATSEQ